MVSKIHIARAFWGNSEHTRKEVPPVSIFENEVVYVWGKDNQKFLADRGYNTLLMHVDITDPRYSTSTTQYFHKLEVFREAEERFGEFIFLDWDCYLVRPLDQQFYDMLLAKETQMPLYAYNNEMYLGIVEMITHPALERYKDQLTDNFIEYVTVQERELRKYHWKQDGLLVSPNACFFYNRKAGVGEKLLEIAKSSEMQVCVEEHAFYVYANCSIEEYLVKHEPPVLQGTSNDARTLHPTWIQNDPVLKINNYIHSRFPKSIYFKHV